MNNYLIIFIILVFLLILNNKKFKKKKLIFVLFLLIFNIFIIKNPKLEDILNYNFEKEIKIEEIENQQSHIKTNENENIKIININNIPEYSGKPYIILNNNIPFYDKKDFKNISFEQYSELDKLGRCGIAIANIGIDLMPTEKRKSIGTVKPTGWHTIKYDNIDGKYLYNRAHLIGYQLTGENKNIRNLITGTRYLNVEGMLPFENMVADYVKETKNHVLYRVTPIFENENLIANGVVIEAKSVEDDGEGILFNVYCYNIQPGIKINYKTGASSKQ